MTFAALLFPAIAVLVPDFSTLWQATVAHSHFYGIEERLAVAGTLDRGLAREDSFALANQACNAICVAGFFQTSQGCKRSAVVRERARVTKAERESSPATLKPGLFKVKDAVFEA